MPRIMGTLAQLSVARPFAVDHSAGTRKLPLCPLVMPVTLTSFFLIFDQSEASSKYHSNRRSCGYVGKPELAEACPHIHSPL